MLAFLFGPKNSLGAYLLKYATWLIIGAAIGVILYFAAPAFAAAVVATFGITASGYALMGLSAAAFAVGGIIAGNFGSLIDQVTGFVSGPKASKPADKGKPRPAKPTSVADAEQGKGATAAASSPRTTSSPSKPEPISLRIAMIAGYSAEQIQAIFNRDGFSIDPVELSGSVLHVLSNDNLSPEVLGVCIDNGLDLSYKPPGLDTTLLYTLVSKHNPEREIDTKALVRTLLTKQPDRVDDYNTKKHQRTALHQALRLNNRDMADLLLSFHADPKKIKFKEGDASDVAAKAFLRSIKPGALDAPAPAAAAAPEGRTTPTVGDPSAASPAASRQHLLGGRGDGAASAGDDPEGEFTPVRKGGKHG